MLLVLFSEFIRLFKHFCYNLSKNLKLKLLFCMLNCKRLKTAILIVQKGPNIDKVMKL